MAEKYGKDKFIGCLHPTSNLDEKSEMLVGFPLADSFLHQYHTTTEKRLAFLPAAGYRNDSSLNNAGSNGNYWSSSLNTSNPNNAYNVNFNSSNVNRNNNNRYYGQSVRPVCP